MSNHKSLHQLGWSPSFQQQLALEELETFTIGRVIAQHRSRLEVETEAGITPLSITHSMPAMTVGDWLLLERENHFHRMLDRLTLFARKAAGSKVETQLIAANVDTLFIVSSLNEEFNLNRIERYLAIAAEAGVEPVVVLSKADLCQDPESYVQQIQAVDPMLSVVPVNGQQSDSVIKLNLWCTTGRTVALLGSSGVGKSTLVNTLLGDNHQATQGIRLDDSKGRHTTTGRSLHFIPSGGILIDTPGMRELQLYDCEQGIEESFSDITSLAQQCRFSDCAHQGEPGCAVVSAIEQGELDQRRLVNYRKLMREQQQNSATIAQKRARDRALGRFYRSTLKASQKLKKGAD
ncbi:MAG: ribosome small subunit-dependent GTPase A [Candidatus Thiodiazotropha lotti]|uniref:Small ribosomal subunit biogenesis GTPase RsgA n=1 Tax=Candidatus Thiodiazotropha lotti TaxID=2792787 RepID=A0A9E4N1R8_9GAMM|nr:ribosome small subunit-dependent GTPase A [Candidatus Thiodiazotropha lotti]ODC01296.1 ribosome small subunit-dependent GTPase A [Candidatus Thiodiazotropha endoloripes]MCG7923128.1 ribosome small subunit-dependent GTPase A [Candidatus Thiodiazotropha lotti]MCG7932793.1 ribosome small subunit-dependent GTPase A [Candidatus Thiodiazotropha lotti]MCG7940683.1 ribosome small subunit-dependent GTPase A [Candidatus Thiodiazotropha lotti]